MGDEVLDIQKIDGTQVALAGGKAALLGELMRIEGVRVPSGFCITTEAFRRTVAQAPAIDAQLDRLSRLRLADREGVAGLSGQLRSAIEEIVLPDDLAEAVAGALVRHGEDLAYAVRSSATAEDSPTASFAGQHDTYLHVSGLEAILRDVRRCWASLFSERAVTYRLRGGIEHRHVEMAVVVQQMVVPVASGILFTADPLTCNRKLAVVEAVRGLGEELVSGRVSPDVYTVRDGAIVVETIADEQPALADGDVLALVQLGRRIEELFGRPQDIEWCRAEDGFQIVQSRPITTLFPVPEAGDGENHVYVSVGHQQMMTDAIKPLGLSLWQLTTPRPMSVAGGRLFVDVTKMLGAPTTRAGLLRVLGGSDPLMGDALRTIVERGDFVPARPDEELTGVLALAEQQPLVADPALVTELIERGQASTAALQRTIEAKSGPELIDFILADLQELRRVIFDPRGLEVITSAAEAGRWLNEHMQEWLGEKNVADTLTQSVAGNVTSEMGLALLDVADVIRPFPDVVAFLRDVDDEDCLEQLPALPGGNAAHEAIQAFLDSYGMRCAGEIDITRTRWSEQPSALVPMILAHVRNFEPGAGSQRFEQGRRAAAMKEQELLARLREEPDGERKAGETKQMIDRVRTFAGYREYPKYGMVSRYFIYKQALLREAERLKRAAVLREAQDVFYLTLHEFRDVVRDQEVDGELIRQRKDAFNSYLSLTPPRVLTSEGEVLAGSYRREDLPAGALVGLPVSAGTVEGRARVILDMAQADLKLGDILVTTYTDPSWTPLFVTIGGLITEVGGLMTHGAVIAREYGLPAVVGVERATRLIRDGQRIRVHGTDGYVEVLG
jgi:phosphoenolpyruvate synthase/pyruvate phosphate dikinase